ncbi:hypothetical protein B0T22DRAFT_533112 [Podospora appendiculata]|uniref:Uncharacterized protein n=1 Tax=Podospora appendiculata TaxID=314037 RepID=A0AAE0XID7_9PEZI|nr:hypothetical protein B0T22DRAFT_533112 [Podospora appendiculata]
MFGTRRHRPPNPPLTAATADPDAATAAAAVFKRHESSPLLSAAAAATALRARPMTPTRVADVQTKRTLRRSASVASSTATASDAGYQRPGLRRRESSGSMTERTFRSPSPHRPASSGSGHRQSRSLPDAADLPPVPALPRDVQTGARQEQPHHKTNSLGMATTPLRLASQTLGGQDAPSWFGAARLGDPGNVRRTDPAMASPPSSPPQVVQDEYSPDAGRPGSQASSINFSYPSRVRVGSPTASPVDNRSPLESSTHVAQQQQWFPGSQPSQGHLSNRRTSESGASSTRRRSVSASSDQSLVYDPNSRRMVRRADLLAAEQAVLDSAEQPTRSKKKKQTPQRAGSHLAQGTMGRTKITTSRATPAGGQSSNAVSPPRPQLRVEPHQPRVLEPDQREPAVKFAGTPPRIESKSVEQQSPPEYTRQDAPSTAISVPVPKDSPMTLRRQPSTVKEEPELEHSDAERSAHRAISDALDAVPSRQRVSAVADPNTPSHTEEPQRTDTSAAASPSTFPPDQPTIVDQKQPADVALSPNTALHEPTRYGSPESRIASQYLRQRTHSNSPARQAHFGPVQDSLMVIHSPPARSISPRKSAMKHSSPSRGASPTDDTSEASISFAPREEPHLSRKKSVRVSFDDENTVVVGDSASPTRAESPMLPSPQTANRRPWYSNIGRIKKDLASLDDDEVMKPRPALPSFGSVRDRKPRELSPVEGERPLVRPIAEYNPPTTIGAPVPAPDPLGQSSDHAVGELLAREHEERSRILANTSRFREPLPPVVTSVEGSGYASDSSTSSSSSSGSEFKESQAFPGVSAPVQQEQHVDVDHNNIISNTKQSGSTGTGDETPEKAANDNDKTGETSIPTISISQPSPGIPENKAPSTYFVDVPGGFPDDDSDPSVADSSKANTSVPSGIQFDCAREGILEPTVQQHHSAATSQTPTTVPATQLATVDPPSDSESSIYSDAYEDLSETEGDGFLSLDAVLESPSYQNTQSEGTPQEVASQQPAALEEAPKLGNELSTATTVVDHQPAEAPQDDWEKAKAFWRSLTADKRALLEKEALEDAGIDADLEETELSRKPKKKKSVERRNSERKVLAVHLAQQIIVQQERDNSANPERSYMIKPGTKWAQSESDNGPTMRKSLRSEPQHQPAATPGGGKPRLRKSMRTDSSARSAEVPQPSGRVTASGIQRPASLPPQPTVPHATANRRKVSGVRSEAASGSPMANYNPPPTQRRGSTSSESSFKRARGAPGGQGFSFRKSMRQPSPSAQGENRSVNKRFSLRSMSPSGSQFRQSPDSPPAASSPQMRRTLRDSSSERKSPTGGMRLPTFGLASGGKKSVGGKRASKSFSSRFGDSSDEDNAGISTGFRSRFEDSSDDEAVTPMPLPAMNKRTMRTSGSASAPPRHIRNQDSIASTALAEELEESEEFPDANGNSKQNTAATRTVAPYQPRDQASLELRRSRSGRGELPGSQTSPAALGVTTAISSTGALEQRPSSASKRSSFMSVLRRKKHGSVDGKISRPGVSESAARRDTKLERSADQLRGIRTASVAGGSDAGTLAEDMNEEEKFHPQAPRSPKLQKKIATAAAAGSVHSPSVFEEKTASPAATPGLDRTDEKEFGMPRRNQTSGNLGTRTMSANNVPPRPGFLQSRTMSAGLASLDGRSPVSIAGTTGTTATGKKKKFGALRRMFGLND